MTGALSLHRPGRLVLSVLLIFCARTLLRVCPARAVRWTCRRFGSACTSRANDHAASILRELSPALRIAAHALSATCLEEAFACCFAAAGIGARVRLRFGGAVDGSGFHAHAWVELDDDVLTRGSAGGYRPFEPAWPLAGPVA